METKMKKEWLSLSDDQKAWVYSHKELFDATVKMSGLPKETVRECFARILKRIITPDEEFVKSFLKEELKKSQEHSERLGKKIDMTKALQIYNGIILNKMTAMRTSYKKPLEDLVKVDIQWTCDETCLKRIRWKQRMHLNAIYTMIATLYEDCDDDVMIIDAERVYRLIHPKGNYEADKGEFANDLNDTIDRFRNVSGRYTLKGKRGNENETITINSDYFLNCEHPFDDEGKGYKGYFAKSRFQTHCEQNKWVLSFNSEYLKGKTLDEQYLYSYLVFFHETKMKGEKPTVMDITTLKTKIGTQIFNDLQLDTPRILTAYLKRLKPLYKDAKVIEKDKKIIWGGNPF